MQDSKLPPGQAPAPRPPPPQQDIDDFIFAHDQSPAASSR